MHGDEAVVVEVAPERVFEEGAAEGGAGLGEAIIDRGEDGLASGAGPVNARTVFFEGDVTAVVVVGHHQVGLRIADGAAIGTAEDALEFAGALVGKFIEAGFLFRACPGRYRGEGGGKKSAKRAGNGAFLNNHAVVELGLLTLVDNAGNA